MVNGVNIWKVVHAKTRRVRVHFEILHDLGRKEKGYFDVDFRVVPESERQELRRKALVRAQEIMSLKKRIEAGELIDEAELRTLGNQDLALILDHAEGWAGVMDADGEALPFTRENLEYIADLPGIGTAIVDTFVAQMLEGGAARKN